jgi:hypothetical protein
MADVDVRLYRAAMRRAAAAEKALRAERVEHAAQLAAIPVHLPAGRAFVSTYDGPLDIESVHAAAIAFGVFLPEGASIISTEPGDPHRQVDADRAALVSYALTPPAKDPDS